MSEVSEALAAVRQLKKESFVPMAGQQQGGGQPAPGGPPPAAGGQLPPEGAPPPQGGGEYPPELLQAAQQFGIPVGQDGIPIDPQSGQPIPPEALVQMLQQMQSQGGPPPPGGPPAEQPPAEAPPPEAAPAQQEQATPEGNMQALMEMNSAIQQIGAALQQTQEENKQLRQELTAQVQTFQKSVSEIQGSYKMILDTLKSPATPEQPMEAPMEASLMDQGIPQEAVPMDGGQAQMPMTP